MKKLLMTCERLCATLILAAAMLLASCDVLEVEPQQSVAGETALQDRLDYEALLVSIYDRAQELTYYGQWFMLVPEALADNIQNTPNNSGRYPSFERNAVGAHLTRYGGHYFAINEANYIIDQVGNLEVEGVSAEEAEAVRNRIEGEARFMRALNYFDLARTKAYEPGREVDGFNLGVVLQTEPTRSVEEIAGEGRRATNDEVYDLIESDLQQAIDLLGNRVTTPYRANQVAAQALLARAHLYQGALGEEEWAAAEQLATAALENVGLVGARLVTDDSTTEGSNYFNAWTAQERMPESIFSIDFEETNDGAVTGFNGSLASLTTPEGWGELVPTQSLLDAYEEGDVRAGMYVSAPKGAQEFLYSMKWSSTEGPYTHNVPVIRYSELLLIRAEARAELGDLSGALEDLNRLRNARLLPDLPSGLSQQEIIDAVLRERRVEFAFEGQRFFDLKRRGRDIPKPQTGSVIPYRGGALSFLLLAPLPDDEVTQFDLTQNPGY